MQNVLMTGLKEPAAQSAELTRSEAGRVASQLREVLASPPADKASYLDNRIRRSVEMFLVGYNAGSDAR